MYRWYQPSKSLNNAMKYNVIDNLVTYKKKTVERRVLLSCLFRSYSGVELKELLSKHTEVLEEVLYEEINGDEGANVSDRTNVVASGTEADNSEDLQVSQNVTTVRTLFPLRNEDTNAEYCGNTKWNRTDTGRLNANGTESRRKWGNRWGDDENGAEDGVEHNPRNDIYALGNGPTNVCASQRGVQTNVIEVVGNATEEVNERGN